MFPFRDGMEFENVSRTACATSRAPRLAMKLHLAFGGMNVHVHARGINFQKQTADRVTAFHQRGVIAFEQREVDASIFDGRRFTKTCWSSRSRATRRARR
jgi:hypothetical protein